MKSPSPKRVPRDAFRALVRWAPIASIDLIITNKANQVLLGYRANRPAFNTWFVPGGRIFKGERIAQAMERIALCDTGIAIKASRAAFLGVHEHFYRNSVLSNSRRLTTHYVVLAFRIRLKTDPGTQRDSQHKKLAWLRPAEVLRHAAVHENTKAYFRGTRRSS